MYTIMHVSDLHRSEGDRISNDELLSCLLADCGRFGTENPPISWPNAIVICGDLIQGLPLGSSDYPKALERQYDEAYDLLTRLADSFVGGDHSKIVIIPGNHDVDWNMAKAAMVNVEPNKYRIRDLLSNSNSDYRWSWESLQLLEIKNRGTYDDRFKYFRHLYERFYNGVSHVISPDSKRAWNLFELDDGKIIVCAFNSCTKTDCFSFFGEIPAQAIAQSHLAVGDKYLLRIAVWHHDVQGPARRFDYIDPDTIQMMIDKGYRIGMHGHQHKSDAIPYYLHTFEKNTMAVVGTGSLCANTDQLPTGVRRQYNIIEISENYCQARVHVREMRVRDVFSPGWLVAFDRHSYADIEWTSAPPSSPVNAVPSGAIGMMVFEEVEKLIAQKAYEEATAAIYKANLQGLQYGRQLLSEALFRGEMWEKLEDHVSPPRNDDELIKSVLASIALKHWGKAEKVLQVAEESGHFQRMTILELRKRLTATKGISL